MQPLCRPNDRASVVVVEPGGTNRNETKNTGPMGVCGRANTSAMHSQCIAQPHIPDVQWGHWGHHPRVREARVGCNHKIPSTTIIGCGGEHRKQANNMVLVRAGNIAQSNVTVPTLFFSTSTVPAFTTIVVVTFTTGHFQPK